MPLLDKLRQTEVPVKTEAGGYYPYSEKLEAKYILEDRFGEPYYLYRRDGKYLVLPRNLCPVNEKKDKRVVGPKQVSKFASKFEARHDDQASVTDASTQLLQMGRNHILEAMTGFGKTVVGSEIIHRIGRKTLVIVTKADIVEQWRDALVNVIGYDKDKIGQIQGDICEVTGKDVVIAMVHSVCKYNRYPSWIYKEFGLVVVDEVHMMGADQFSQAQWHFPAKLWLGLSATPYRKDGRDNVFRAHIGPVMVKGSTNQMVPKVIMKESGWQVPRVKANEDGKVTMVPVPHQPGKTMHISKLLAKNVKRNNMIANFTKQAYDKGRNIVIFSELKEKHLAPLKDFLIVAGVPSDDIAFYVGGMTEEQRDKAKAHRVVLTTYQMCSTATDAPWWDTCVLGMPRSDVVQIVGRIRREYPDKKQPLVFDITDNDSDIFENYAISRQRWYKKIGAEVVRR